MADLPKGVRVVHPRRGVPSYKIRIDGRLLCRRYDGIVSSLDFSTRSQAENWAMTTKASIMRFPGERPKILSPEGDLLICPWER